MLLLFLRRQYHHHLTPFHLRHLFDLAKLIQIGAQTFQHAHTNFLVGHFAAPETQRDLRLVAFVQEADQVAQLDRIVAVIGTRPEFDLLDLDDFLFKLGLMRLF